MPNLHTRQEQGDDFVTLAPVQRDLKEKKKPTGDNFNFSASEN